MYHGKHRAPMRTGRGKWAARGVAAAVARLWWAARHDPVGAIVTVAFYAAIVWFVVGVLP